MTARSVAGFVLGVFVVHCLVVQAAKHGLVSIGPYGEVRAAHG